MNTALLFGDCTKIAVRINKAKPAKYTLSK